MMPGRQIYLQPYVTFSSLHQSVISADSADSFKDWLDKFWSSQDILFDYKADLTRISNKSLPEMDE